MRKLIALGAIAAVIGIVLLANQGLAVRYFGFLYSFPSGDKLGHFGIMGMLTCAVTLAFPRAVRVGAWQLPAAPLLILLAVTLEELSQGLVPGRSLAFSDWLANLAGITVGGWAGWRLARSETATSP